MSLDKRAQTPAPIVPGVLYVDPPSGWRYGFPKALPADLIDDDVRPWLVAQGYPASCLTAANFTCRYYYEEPE